MASPPPVAHPVPARSPEKLNAALRHPIPDLQSLQGAYVGNIERLEEHAERMSESGSDLGEEIRKLHTELKRSDSRRESLDEPSRQLSTRSRNVSVSSHANSIVDVNGAARWGGYSPAGYVTSPVGSLRSGSWSAPSTSVQRQRSESKASRLGQVVHPDEIMDERDNYLAHPGSPKSLRSAPLAVHSPDSPPPQNTRRVSSFTRKYDEIANELRHELRNSVHLDQPAHHSDEQHSEEYRRYVTRDDYPDRPPTAASTDTSRQARTLWHDFDGAHCPDTVLEEAPTPTRGAHSRHSSYGSMLRMPEQPSQGAPPPNDAMVFYPAPVPRMLNLPKRLSQLPTSDVQARRRTQVLDHMQAENRKSAPMIGDMVGEEPKPARKSRQSMLNLPPQLRASAYFDNHVAPAQEYAVQGESAEDTLDSILNASARAPVSAFTDHPFAGSVGPEVYGPEHRRKTSKLAEVPPPLAETRRRSSFMMLDTKRNSSGDPLNKLKKRNSSADMNLLILKASESRMSLTDELDEHGDYARGPDDGNTTQRKSLEDVDGRNPDDVYNDQHMNDELEEEEREEEEEVDEPQYYGAPTTLLAELQLRKAKQKTRNMNYATLVEQGNMPTHRTLLELDDIAEKEKQKRLKKKVNLAWEAQGDDDSDDDVPLGVLYQKPKQQNDWDRPIGLIAQRELEDAEPLSRRRARLHATSSNKLRPSPSQLHLGVPTTTTPGPETDEDEGETLGERMRRLREKKEIDAALGDDIRKSTISMDFASEMMSKFGVAEGADKAQNAPQPTPSPGAEEEETLGQRRARLQAEAALQGNGTQNARPAYGTSLSMADVLSSNPIDVHNQARKVSDQQLVSHLAQGSLLQQNVVAEERRKAERQLQNMRSSSYGAYDPLIRAAPDRNDDDQPIALKIQAYKNKMAGISAPDQRSQSMMHNGMPAMNMPGARESMMPGNQPMMMGMNGMGMMSTPNLGMMNMNMPMNMMGMQQQMPMNGMGMGMRQPNMQMPMQMNGMPMMGMPMGMNMNGMAMGGMMMPPMDPRQRDNIDRWMQGIQH
ncbi:hypothetical protein DE146DRAFT_40051 [Phaeosphaeria sp. MPI-PUGE-AT-0046c]|nr:hypothetical protein DE146DRAFT_40051 [Phaeosphaeria sp. MPI-PUGE-AT-0046c]